MFFRQMKRYISSPENISSSYSKWKMSFLLFYAVLNLPHPSTAWSKEVLHNLVQDLVKVFACVFTNNSAAYV